MDVGRVPAVVYDENHNEIGNDHAHRQAEHEQGLDDFPDAGAQQEGGTTGVAWVGTARVSYRGRYQPCPFRVH